jgi:hypothetical protein
MAPRVVRRRVRRRAEANDLQRIRLQGEASANAQMTVIQKQRNKPGVS